MSATLASHTKKARLPIGMWRLQEQPFHILAMLLEHPGEVVTREELQKRLWPADTFVDFDHGLNKAISKIREALGDSPESPRFVETVARRGYRFLTEVKLADAALVRSPELEAQPHPGSMSGDRADLAGESAKLKQLLPSLAWKASILEHNQLPNFEQAVLPAS